MKKEILLIDKPEGVTSFDVIRTLRKKLGVKKMGHAGTLDPLASGLLIIGVGEGTKRLNELIKLPKTYEAAILLGRSTTTGDREGEITREKDIAHLSSQNIEKTIKEMEGKNEIPVPLYSAVKVDGRKLYEYARAGEEVRVPMRDMVVRRSQIKAIRKVEESGKTFYEVDVTFDVESGVYIRSLAEEVGRRLDVPSMLVKLRRTEVGKYSVENAEKI